jgi:hypothetical protein
MCNDVVGYDDKTHDSFSDTTLPDVQALYLLRRFSIPAQPLDWGPKWDDLEDKWDNPDWQPDMPNGEYDLNRRMQQPRRLEIAVVPWVPGTKEDPFFIEFILPPLPTAPSAAPRRPFQCDYVCRIRRDVNTWLDPDIPLPDSSDEAWGCPSD